MVGAVWDPISDRKAFRTASSYHDTATSGRGVFYNEATVGAGLPIISTLKDVVNTGDKVGVLDRVGGR